METIARIAHEVTRAYCAAHGDHSQLAWEDAPEWQRLSAIHGVQALLTNPDISPEELHRRWVEEKIAQGWVWGKVKDTVAKTHPCMVEYEALPLMQQVKDSLFRTVVLEVARLLKGQKEREEALRRSNL